MDVYARAGRPAAACGRSRLAKPPSGDARTRTRSDFHVPPLSNSHELGDMRSPCSAPCPPAGTYLERLHGGTSTGTSTGTGGVHNRKHGAGRCRCMRANSDMHGGGKLPPPCDLRVRSGMPRGQSWSFASLRANPDICGGANLAPPRDLEFYRTTDAPLGLFRLWRTNRTTMVLPNWQDHTTWAGARGPIGITGSRCRCRRRSPATAPGQPPPDRDQEGDPRHALDRPRGGNRTSAVPRDCCTDR